LLCLICLRVVEWRLKRHCRRFRHKTLPKPFQKKQIFFSNIGKQAIQSDVSPWGVRGKPKAGA
jgi:hypothetical protein